MRTYSGHSNLNNKNNPNNKKPGRFGTLRLPIIAMCFVLVVFGVLQILGRGFGRNTDEPDDSGLINHSGQTIFNENQNDEPNKIKFFYAVTRDDDYVLEYFEIEFIPGNAADFIAVLEEGFKFRPFGADGRFVRTIGEDVRINKIVTTFHAVNPDDDFPGIDSVQIDFGTPPVPSTYTELQRNGALHALAETLMEIYNVNAVSITLRNMQYQYFIKLEDAQWAMPIYNTEGE
jgi:hypothetical protein